MRAIEKVVRGPAECGGAARDVLAELAAVLAVLAPDGRLLPAGGVVEAAVVVTVAIAAGAAAVAATGSMYL